MGALGQQIRQLRLHHEEREQIGAEHDHEQNAADTDRAFDRLEQRGKRELAADHAENDGAERADRGRFGRAEYAGIDAANGHDEQREKLPRAFHGGEPLTPRHAFASRGIAFADIRDQHRHRHIKRGQQQAGDQAGGEQPRHRLLGDRGVDHHDDRRRNQDAEAAAGGKRAGGKPHVIAGLAHFGQRDPRHGRRGGDRGAAHRAEGGASRERRYRDSAAHTGKRHARRPEQIGGQAGFRGDFAHQHEQRHHRQRIGGAGIEWHGTGQRQCGHRA